MLVTANTFRLHMTFVLLYSAGGTVCVVQAELVCNLTGVNTLFVVIFYLETASIVKYFMEGISLSLSLLHTVVQHRGDSLRLHVDYSKQV